MRANRLSRVVIRIAVILLCLCLFSAHLTSGMFAKYATSVGSDDSVKVGEYGVSVISLDNGDPLAVDPLGNVIYRFQVDNSKSSVAVSYDIDIRFLNCYDGDTLVSSVENMYSDVLLNNYTYNEQSTDNDRYISYSFKNVGSLAPGEISQPLALTFNTSLRWTEQTDDSLADGTIQVDNQPVYPVQVFVHAVQNN